MIERQPGARQIMNLPHLLFLLGVCAWLAVAWPSSMRWTSQSAVAAPPRPTLTPTPWPTPTPWLTSTPWPTQQPTQQPTSQPTERPAPTGGQIILRAEFAPTWPWDEAAWQEIWTVVQWQDREGKWHDVTGWRGGLNEIVIDEKGKIVGQRVWWIERADLGKGPFRWLVYRDRKGALIATSDPFYLPTRVSQSRLVRSPRLN